MSDPGKDEAAALELALKLATAVLQGKGVIDRIASALRKAREEGEGECVKRGHLTGADLRKLQAEARRDALEEVLAPVAARLRHLLSTPRMNIQSWDRCAREIADGIDRALAPANEEPKANA